MKGKGFLSGKSWDNRRGLTLLQNRLLKDIYEAQVGGKDDEFNNKRNELKSYGKKYGYNEIDRKILNFLLECPDASLREISEYTNFTMASTQRRIFNLQKIGVVREVREGRQTRWKVNPIYTNR